MNSSNYAEKVMGFVRPTKTHDVADYMSLSEDSVLRMVRSGQIPAKRVGNEYYYDPRQIAALCGIAAPTEG